MTVNSMTGFARASGSLDGTGWLWEMKSVNGRGLEIRCRMPAGFDGLEDRLRKLVKARFHRGSVNLHLQFERTGGETGYRVNEPLLSHLLDLAHGYVEAGRAKTPRIDGMLGLKGVIEPEEADLGTAEKEKLEQALFASAEELMSAMAAVRAEEGAQLLPVLAAQLDAIGELTAKAAELAKSWPENARAKIAAQMALILENATLEEARLEQELALLTTRADISEELDRLAGHVAACRELLGPNGTDAANAPAIGRRLDFICQEFNREANTLCSKANDREITQVGLDLKVAIDKMREQVQNIE